MNRHQRTNIYLHIDGVLLANDRTCALHAPEFLQYVLAHFPDTTYWLTTHCQGDADTPIQHIGHLFSASTVDLMRKIKPTRWDLAKTDAIDFSEPFLWFDDDLFEMERAMLLKHRALDNWIEVDLAKTADQLARFLVSFPLPMAIR